MATNAPAALVWLAHQWESAIDSASKRNDAATISGIVGDAAHRKGGGYHISRQDQPASNYSVADCSADRQGNASHAAAIDMSMRAKDMTLVTNRLHDSWANRNDPRLNHCRGINGTLDGVHAIRFDCQFHTTQSATADHLWHVHFEVLRQWADDMATMRDILSIINGAPYAGVVVPRPDESTHVNAPAFAGRVIRLATSKTLMMHGEDVRVWQAQMRARGWKITADSWYGPGSALVCRQFQAEKGLSVDGQVGPQTWAAAWTTRVT